MSKETENEEILNNVNNWTIEELEDLISDLEMFKDSLEEERDREQ